MTWLFDFWRSSIGGKVTMAVTGLVLFGFVVAHLLGNLQFLSQPDHINEYAKFLHREPALLWTARLVLLTSLVLHVVTGLRLAKGNRGARPVGYTREATIQASLASRSMVLTGLSTLVFIVYHLLHFTAGVVHHDDYARGVGAGGNLHATMTASFGSPLIVTAYVVGQLVLFFHLQHGIQSLAQTLGFTHARFTPVVRMLSIVIAGLIAIANTVIVTAVLTGLVKVAS